MTAVDIDRVWAQRAIEQAARNRERRVTWSAEIRVHRAFDRAEASLRGLAIAAARTKEIRR